MQILCNQLQVCHCSQGILVLIALIVIVIVHGTWKRLQSRKNETRLVTPPGRVGLPLIGETIQFMLSIKSAGGFYSFVEARRQRYGSCFKTSIFRETHVFVSSTRAAKAVLNNDSGIFTKRYIQSIAELVGRGSLLCASHHSHKLLRSRLVNLFSLRSTALMIRPFDELVVDALRDWDSRGTVVLLTESLKITFRAMCKMLMSLENEEELEPLQRDVSQVCEAMLAFPLRLPRTRFFQGVQARKRIMDKLGRIIAERKESGAVNHEDYLQHLLADGNTELTESVIKDNMLTMIIAGQDTTASAITWMIKYVGEQQEVLDRLAEEQESVARKRSAEKPYLTPDDLNEMPYALKVVKESLRMSSIVPWFPRLVLQDTEIAGYNIREGWNLNIDARAVHFDPMIYSEPTVFDPSRFDDESKPYSFLAFGMGGRTCLGLNMAKAMMLVFLHRFVTTYRWEVTDADPSIEKWALFARLKSGCPIHVTRRLENHLA